MRVAGAFPGPRHVGDVRDGAHGDLGSAGRVVLRSFCRHARQERRCNSTAIPVTHLPMSRALSSPMRGLLPIIGLLQLAGASASKGQQAVRPLEFTRFALPNGMTVILNVDHATPLVAVNVTYHVGAKDDPPGQRGITHLCEHAIALGSPNVDQPLQPFYRSIGGASARAETTDDLTSFYVVVP